MLTRTTDFPFSQYLTVVRHDDLAVKIFMQDQVFSQCLFDAVTFSSVDEVNSMLSIFAAKLCQLVQFKIITLDVVQNYFINAQCPTTQLSLLQQVIVHSVDKIEKLKLLVSFFQLLINVQVISPYSLSVMISKPNAFYSSAYNYFCTVQSKNINSNFLYNELLIQWKKGILSTENFSAIQLFNVSWGLRHLEDNNIHQQFLNLNELVQARQLNFVDLQLILTVRYKGALDFATRPNRSNKTLHLFLSLLRECVNNGAWPLTEYHRYIERTDFSLSVPINDAFFNKFPSYTHELNACRDERKLAKLNMQKEQKERECTALINSLPGWGMFVERFSLFNTNKEFSYFSSPPASNPLRFCK